MFQGTFGAQSMGRESKGMQLISDRCRLAFPMGSRRRRLHLLRRVALLALAVYGHGCINIFPGELFAQRRIDRL